MEDQLHPNWKAMACAHLKWKVFVQANSEEKEPEKVKSKTYAASLSGDEAKKIYEDIIQESPNQNADLNSFQALSSLQELSESSTSGITDMSVDNANICPGMSQHNIRTLHKAMSLAQNNERASLIEMFENGFDVNSKDEHGWSLLMVAACAGSYDVVETLLKYKAKTGVRDAKGNTAVYLAGMKGHKKIVDLLIKSQKKKQDHCRIENSTVSPCDIVSSQFFCEICKRTFKESTRRQHETSIVHQFNVGSVESKTVYGISPNNKGYQLLVNQGWNTEKGLGPNSSGPKFPVKTILKRNREGLGGSSQEKAKITHFGPGDEAAVKGEVKSTERIIRQKILNRRERNKEKIKERRKEADLRRMLNEPDF